MRHFTVGVSLLSALVLLVAWGTASVLAAEQPRYDGILRVAIAGDPPSLDMHQEQTFKVTIPLSTCYNTLVRFDPHAYPKIIGDLAKSWTASDDGLTYTFTLHKGVKFHDGTELTSADVKASWDKIVFPPEGVVSPRRSFYEAIKSIEAPDPSTVVFRLHYPSASLLSMLAHPANFVYAKKYLDQDINYYKQHVMGTGPFKLKEYVRGSRLEVERNPDYFKKGLPYLDGIKYYMMPDTSARANSIRSGRTDVEFRSLPPAEVEVIKAQLGDAVVVRYPRAGTHWGVAINVDRKPFDDERVRTRDRTRVLKRMTGLLAGCGVRLARPGDVEAQLNQAHQRDGSALPAALWARLQRE